MRYSSIVLALALAGCSAHVDAVGPEVCDGLDNDGDGCVDVLYDPDGLDGIAAWPAIVLDGQACIDGELEPIGDGFDASEIYLSCDSGATRD